MGSACVMVMTTVATEQQAEELARGLVEAGLAACVQIEPIRSVYRWKGEVCAEAEFRLTAKTTEQRYTELEAHIKAHHAYETPEIVMVPIAGGSREYLAWVDECTRGG